MPAGQAISEIARILRPDGVFAAYDYDWPPLADWKVAAAFSRVIEASGVDPSRPEKAGHAENLKDSGQFRAVRTVFMHARQVAGSSHVARLPLAFGPVARRLSEGNRARTRPRPVPGSHQASAGPAGQHALVELPGQYRDQITGAVAAGLTVPESDVTSLRKHAPNWAIGAVRLT